MNFQNLIFIIVAINAGSAQELTNATNAQEKDVKEILYTINGIFNFVEKFFYQINIDGLLGMVLAQAQLEQIMFNGLDTDFDEAILESINKCENLCNKIVSLLPKISARYQLFAKYLLQSRFWYNKVQFDEGHLVDLGIYKNWTASFILSQRTAAYRDISTDVCLEEILRQNEKTVEFKECSVSPLCHTVVLGDRNDTAYLLTHRLFYLQIAHQSKCIMGARAKDQYIRRYCSQIWKESKTNEFLGFPQHDIFIEQVVFCGMEGFEEFLIPRWRNTIVQWQTVHGCYISDEILAKNVKRNTNVIEFGCTDHTTGLAAAALAVNLRNMLRVNSEG